MIKSFSSKKSASNTVVNSIPAFVFVIANYINKKYNLGFDDVTLDAVITALAVVFYWVKNYIKNKNK